MTLTLRREGDRCPHIKRYPEGGPDFCKHMGHFCLLESGEECPEWNEIQEEWRQEQL